MNHDRQILNVGEYGLQVLQDLYVVSWLGMSSPRIDCHVYVLRGHGGLLMIDCGTPWGHERILRNMAHWGLDICDVRSVLCTHSHVDHVSGGYLFKQRGVELLGHRETLAPVEGQWEAQGILDERGQAWRMDGTLAGDDHIRRCGFEIEVLHTPGHTRGCMSYRIKVNGELCLFSGDLIMGDGLPGWSGNEGHDLTAIADSLRKLGEIPFDHLCFGHGVILNDRGYLFREALSKYANGDWIRPDSRYVRTRVPGREPAAR